VAQVGKRRAPRRRRSGGRATTILLGVATVGLLGAAAVGGDLLEAQRGAAQTDAPAHSRTVPQVDAAVPAPTRTTRTSSAAPVRLTLPARSGSGRRVVYSERTMHVWLVDARNHVVRDFPVIGRPNKPRPGSYLVYSKSAKSSNAEYGVTFRWMVRFTKGDHLPIGFHDLPIDAAGRYFDRPQDLGKPLGRGGCAASEASNARFLYRWAGVGTPVVVVH
jgi:hypothetical protein